ncbi:hypothetical protein ZIOFF_045958 [Zingiber officinale]|uniref:DUF5667 domain-containing protein n=1 Tax=Zingiber officinale TaxID=94328 RepID=A0A8J5FY75_ZINOF|nr:hypothetical protein ZIOFF_045958 [Zingiber officinale]
MAHCRIVMNNGPLRFVVVPLIIFLIASALLPPAMGATASNPAYGALDPNKPFNWALQLYAIARMANHTTVEVTHLLQGRHAAEATTDVRLRILEISHTCTHKEG